jgi:hypothetical protein
MDAPRRLRLLTSALVAGLALTSGASVPAAAAPAARPGPEGGTVRASDIETCPVFPADNIWNTDIRHEPVHARSGTWLASMKSSSTKLHPDFGDEYGIPFTTTDSTHPTVGIEFDYADESDPGPFPFGADSPIEGGSDRHAIMVDTESCTLYELFDAHWNNGHPTAGSGAIWDLRSNALRPNQWTSADAAGLPIYPGLLRYDEVLAGSITHAIRFTAIPTDGTHLWPARHDASDKSGKTYPPMGARFRMKKAFDAGGYSAQAKVIITAMKHYGLILADNGSNWYFQGAEDPRWPSSLIEELKRIPASAFVAIDESGLKVSKDSGQAK